MPPRPDPSPKPDWPRARARGWSRSRSQFRSRSQSRLGHYGPWWGKGRPPVVAERAPYWAVTRWPLPCLVFVGPMLLAYELGVLSVGGGRAETWRTGADAWMRHGLTAIGLTDRWFPPLCLVLILLAWQAVAAREWRFSPLVLLGMAIESVVLAVALVGMSRLVDLGFENLERGGRSLLETGAPAAGPPWAALLGFLGAGVYEEALFRLLLVPLLFAVLRLLQTPAMPASTLAVTASALLFSLAHHAGTPGEAFTWFAFIFRWTAGVYFAWIFIVRGFGVAVGTHTAYDILVGWIGWHL